MNKLRWQINVPLMANLLEDRRLGWATLGAATLQMSLVSAGLPGWPCPFRHALGIPCPGCGLSRATVALFQGDWEAAFTYHAFVSVVIIALLILIGSSLLPQTYRLPLMRLTKDLEERTGLTALVLVAMLGYWLMRLVVFQERYLALIMG